MARFDVVAELHRIDVPALVTVGALDPVTPVAAGQEIAAGMSGSTCQLEVLQHAGHFPWLDDPDRYGTHLERAIAAWVGQGGTARTSAASDASTTSGERRHPWG